MINKEENNDILENAENQAAEHIETEEIVSDTTSVIDAPVSITDTKMTSLVNIDYLDSKILEVKEYTYEELNQLTDDQKDSSFSTDFYDVKVSDVSEKQVVKGNVVAIYDKEVIVDIGFKSEGIIDKNEFDTIPEIGAEIDVFLVVFEDRKGRLILSKRRADFEKRWSELRAAAENDTILKGEIIKIIKGGLVVDLGVVNAFLPGSQVDIKPVANFEEFLNKEFEFKIVKFNEFRQNVVVSRKATMSSDLDQNRKEFLENIEVGSEVEGTVKNITDFGAFIDLGGIDGLLHITDITWGRINHPSDKVTLGSNITVKVIDYDEERHRISLGLKQLFKDPWDNAVSKYKENTKVSGKVVNMMNYGAFVEIEEGIEGLIHVSEISWTKHIKHPSDIYKIGDNIDAVVLSIDSGAKKISLGVKQLDENPWNDIENSLKVDEKCDGSVSNITSNGAYIKMDNDLEGFLNNNDISWTRKIKNASDVLKKEDKLKLIVLDVSSKDKKITLGLKQLHEDPWLNINNFFNLDDIVNGKVLYILDKGIIFLLNDDFEGILPISKIDENDKESFKINQDLELTISQINTENRKIVLNYKSLDNTEKPLDEQKESEDNEPISESNEIIDEIATEEK